MQLDADTGEERRWVERKTDELIDLTGEDEGEGVAVNQVDFEETLEGNGGDEEPINQVIGEDGIGHNSEEEGDGKGTKRGNGDAVKADGNKADREEAEVEDLETEVEEVAASEETEVVVAALEAASEAIGEVVVEALVEEEVEVLVGIGVEGEVVLVTVVVGVEGSVVIGVVDP